MRDEGYTFIEILIVLFIISLVYSIATISVNHNTHQKMVAFADELKESLLLAEEEALMQAKPIGFVINQQTYQFMSLDGSSSISHWMVLQDSPLKVHTIPDQYRVSFTLDQHASQSDAVHSILSPSIIFSTEGRVTPFVMHIHAAGEQDDYVISGDENGEIKTHWTHLT